MEEDVVVRELAQMVGILEEEARDEFGDGLGGVIEELLWLCHGDSGVYSSIVCACCGERGGGARNECRGWSRGCQRIDEREGG